MCICYVERGHTIEKQLQKTRVPLPLCGLCVLQMYGKLSSTQKKWEIFSAFLTSSQLWSNAEKRDSQVAKKGRNLFSQTRSLFQKTRNLFFIAPE